MPENPYQRLPLTHRFLVDGGYISWIYGSSYERMGSWSNGGRLKFRRSRGAILLIDSPHSFRQDHSPHYKERRVTRRIENPEWTEKTALVNEFKADLPADPSLDIIQIDGCEADDLIAILAGQQMLPFPISVVGVDKDLLQLGTYENFRMKRVTGERMTIGQYASRLPKQAFPFVQTPEAVLLSLILLGDKSDSIPRLIPPRELHIFQSIMKDSLGNGSVWKKAYRMFGKAFLENLYLTILPGPFVYRENFSPQAVYQRLLKGFPTSRLSNQIRPEILEQIIPILNTNHG